MAVRAMAKAGTCPGVETKTFPLKDWLAIKLSFNEITIFFRPLSQGNTCLAQSLA